MTVGGSRHHDRGIIGLVQDLESDLLGFESWICQLIITYLGKLFSLSVSFPLHKMDIIMSALLDRVRNKPSCGNK